MASRRQLQVGEMIRRHFSVVLQMEGSYIYGSAVLVSVTHVLMSSDLGLAKIYLSVFNADEKMSIIALLEENTPRLKNLLSQRIRKQIRRIPNIEFYLDTTLDEIERIDDLLSGLAD